MSQPHINLYKFRKYLWEEKPGTILILLMTAGTFLQVCLWYLVLTSDLGIILQVTCLIWLVFTAFIWLVGMVITCVAWLDRK